MKKSINKNELTERGEYEGLWKRDMREGQGTMKWYDGSKFDGVWFQDMRHHGVMIMTDGNQYQGEFKNDRYHGKGKIIIKL